MKGYVIDTLFEQSLLNPPVCFDKIQTPSLPSWVTRPHQSEVNVKKLNLSANVGHLQQSVETPNLSHKLPPKLMNYGCLVLYVNHIL